MVGQVGVSTRRPERSAEHVRSNWKSHQRATATTVRAMKEGIGQKKSKNFGWLVVVAEERRYKTGWYVGLM